MRSTLVETDRFYWVLGINTVHRIYFEITGQVWVISEYEQSNVNFEYDKTWMLTGKVEN